jgi:hypothetical protein
VKEVTKFTAQNAASQAHYVEAFCNEKSLGVTAVATGATLKWDHTFTMYAKSSILPDEFISIQFSFYFSSPHAAATMPRSRSA